MKTTNITIKYNLKLAEKLKKTSQKKALFLVIFVEITTSLSLKPSIILFVIKNISSSLLLSREISFIYLALTNLLMDI